LRSVLVKPAESLMSKQYETTIIVTPVFTETELQTLISNYVAFLKNNGSEIVHENFWGLRQLAYPIQKKTSGFYYTVEYTSPTGDIVDKLELNFRRDENILRFLTVKLDKYSIEYNDRKSKGLIGKKARAKDTEVTE